jgi:hypothetical protein
MSLEECGDTAACVQNGLLVVGDAAKTQELEPEVLMVVHKRMPGVGVFFSRRRKDRFTVVREQEPMTSTRPLQSGWAESQARADSMSSKVGPARAAASRMIERNGGLAWHGDTGRGRRRGSQPQRASPLGCGGPDSFRPDRAGHLRSPILHTAKAMWCIPILYRQSYCSLRSPPGRRNEGGVQ